MNIPNFPSQHDVSRFRSLIAERMGLHIDESRMAGLAEVLRNRANTVGGNCQLYLEQLGSKLSPADEVHMLARELTVTETYFFRNPDQFSAFSEIALPNSITACAGRRAVQILSLGCASGEEAYSLAIKVHEQLTRPEQVEISAVDINPAMLAKAATAHYSNWSLRETTPGRQARWFKPEGDTFVLDPMIRKAVNFDKLNLAQENPNFWRAQRFDIVFCRNVLMYFSIAQARAAMRRITHALVSDGYLFLGHAETLRGLSGNFHLCHTHNTFYYQRKQELPESATIHSPVTERWQAATLPLDVSWVATIQQASERIRALADFPVSPAPSGAKTAPNLDLALELLHSERFDQVLEQLGILPAEYVHDTDVLLLKAITLSHSGAWAAAEVACQELLAHDELNAGAHYVLALCRESEGDAQGAIEQDQMAAYLDPSFAMPHLHIGLLSRRSDDHILAARELTLAQSLLQQEDPSRILLFGGGFKREALIALCRAQRNACGESA